MRKHLTIRNQKSKGNKIKYILRICFLVAVCCWLIFQIKRSHYKRRVIKSSETKEGDSLDDIEDKYGRSQTENEDTSEDKDQDEIDSKVHEAREEHYKADDASSAVTHEESGHYLNSTNISENVESQTILKLNESTTNDLEKIQPDPIDSTDFIRFENMDTFDNTEDTVAE
ncbi:hypothetical protein CTI12_AA077460 [Artemisia annua]|uniref:Uncharacterized protein n=1 Tax=Artemisia annua TaxID=35608 RepID=A0A2U1Q1C6_ARTAN|nr:hypothetical protein CTI12_AA077460 [Artemisia annua]